MAKQRLLTFMMCLIVLAFGTAKADTAYWTLTFPADTQEGVSAYYKTWTASMNDGGAWSIYGFNNNNNSTKWTYIRAGWYNSAQIATISTTVSCDASISEVVLTVDKVTASDFNSPAYLQVATDASFSSITETVSLEKSDLVAGDWTFTITNPTSGAYYKLVFDMAKTDENGTLQVSKIVYNTSEKSNTDEDSTETDDDSEDTDDDDSDDSSDTDDSGDTDDTDDEDVTVETTGSGTYADPYTASDATALCEASAYGSESVYVKGIISSISEVSTSYGNATYFISDDGTTTDEFEIYRGYGLDGEKFTSEDDIQVGDTVIVYGVLTLYYSTAEMTTGSSIVYLGRPESSDDDSEDTDDTDDEDVTVETTGSGTYADPYTASDATALCEASAYSSESVYVKGIISSINEVSTSYGNATYFISDDGTTTDEFEIYRGYGLDGEKFTSEDDIQVGDTVIVYGVLTLYYSTAEMTTGSSIVYLGRPESSDDDSEDTDDTDDEDVTVETTGSGTYADPYTASDATALCEASAYSSESVYVKGIISSISEVSTSYGNATYFISDDGTTTDEFEIYRGYGLDGEKFTSEDDIQVGDTVIVYGVLTLYYSTAEMTTGSSIVYLGRPESSDDDGEDTDDTDDETTYAVYAKASTVTSGQSYLLVVQDDENTMYATNHSASYTYGYLYVETVSGLVDTLTVDASGYNAFVLTASETTDGAYTLQDSYGRYLYQSGTYKSFNLSSTNDSYDWTLTQGDDGTWTIAYAASGYWIQYSTGYSSFGVYSSEQSNALLPYLYELVDSTTDTDDESDTDTDTDGDTDDDTDDDTTTTGDTYELVTDASSLAAGDVITFANADAQTGIGEQNENNRNFLTVAVTISDGILTAAETSATFTLSTADDGNWLIQYDLTGYYLTSNTASSNYLSTEESPDGLYSEVTIDIDSDGTATVVFQGDNERRWLRYNANGYFSVYAEGSQQDLQIYRKTASEDDSETAISSVSNTDTAAPQGVYTLSGVRLTGTDNLPAGLYVIDGKKVLVR